MRGVVGKPLLWLAAYSPAKILLVGAALSVLASVLLLNLRFSSLKNLSEEAEDLASCSDKSWRINSDDIELF